MQIESVKCMLMAQDMDRGVGFWRDVVGLAVNLHTPHWSELARGNAIVALHGGGTGEPSASGLSLQVADLDDGFGHRPTALSIRARAIRAALTESVTSRPARSVRASASSNSEEGLTPSR